MADHALSVKCSITVALGEENSLPVDPDDASESSGVPGEFCTRGCETHWYDDGPGFSVPVRWLEIGLFLFQPDRG